MEDSQPLSFLFPKDLLEVSPNMKIAGAILNTLIVCNRLHRDAPDPHPVVFPKVQQED